MAAGVWSADPTYGVLRRLSVIVDFDEPVNCAVVFAALYPGPFSHGETAARRTGAPGAVRILSAASRMSR